MGPFFQLFGSGFSLQKVLDTIIEARPRVVVLGTHHYVQLAESDILQEARPEDLDAVEFILPAGAAVPASCADLMKSKFQKLQVTLTKTGLLLTKVTPYR